MRGLFRRFSRSSAQPMILMYHRVSAPRIDPWGLAVHPDRFREHVDVLRKRRTPLAMSEFVCRFEGGTLPNDAVAVTFDDGYVDNLRTARPLLATAGIPATIFLAAGAIGQRREFWWDELARGLLDECDASWRAWQEPRTDRQRTYLDVWRRMRDANAHERDAAMDRFRETSGLPPADPGDLPMTGHEIDELTRDGLVEIGGHTVTHPMLPLLDPRERRREIAEGKRRCEEWAARPVRGFAYPHGAVDADCRDAVRDSGFSWACTTADGSVRRSCDVYALPRLFVQDWDAKAFEAAVS